MGEMTTKSVKEETEAPRKGLLASGKVLERFITFGAVIVLFIVFSVIAPNFFTMRSVVSLLLQTSAVTIMGIGVTFTIITGGIDLSIGSVIALTGTVAVLAANAGLPVWFSLIVGLFVGAFTGFLNGLLITRLRLPPFIATLGMMMVARGVALTITNAYAYPAADPTFGDLGNNAILAAGPKFPGIPYPVIIMVAVAIIFQFILTKTRLGRYTYAVGSNEEATRLSGIKVSQIKIICYMISGMLAALVGIILASRMITAQPNSAQGYELNAIASAVIGGVSLMGGVGSVVGTVIGSFIIGILTVGLTMAGANYFMQQIVIGLVVIGAVTVDQLKGRK
jgi:ribose transport system permease protein